MGEEHDAKNEAREHGERVVDEDCRDEVLRVPRARNHLLEAHARREGRGDDCGKYDDEEGESAPKPRPWQPLREKRLDGARIPPLEGLEVVGAHLWHGPHELLRRVAQGRDVLGVEAL